MTIEEDSYIQFDIDFDISDLKNFSVALIQEIKEREKDFENGDIAFELENRLGLRNQTFVSRSIFLVSTISAVNIEFFRKAHEESKKKLLRDLESEDSLEKQETVKHGISLIDKEFKEFETKFDKPLGNIILNFTAKDTLDETGFLKAITNNNEQYKIDMINKLITTDFEVNLSGSFYFDKNRYSLVQDFGFREKIEFQKDIREKIGQLYLKRIKFNIDDSPIGINSLEIGEYDEEYNISISIDFKTKKITNLIEKYDILINLIKTLIQEVD